MTIYYVKQDNTIWGCGDPACCGEWYEDIEESFVKCECGIPEADMTEEHLWGCNGGGPVLKWRKAKEKEVIAFDDGISTGYYEGFEAGIEHEKKDAERKSNTIKPKRDRTVHQLVEDGYTVIIEGEGVKETYYRQDDTNVN